MSAAFDRDMQVQDQQDARARTDTSPAYFAIREGKSLLRNNAAVDRDTSLPEKSNKFSFRDPISL